MSIAIKQLEEFYRTPVPRWNSILLAVFVAHGAMVLLATRAPRQMMSAPFSVADSLLLLLLLPQAVPERPNSLEMRRGVELKRSRTPRHEPAMRSSRCDAREEGANSTEDNHQKPSEVEELERPSRPAVLCGQFFVR